MAVNLAHTNGIRCGNLKAHGKTLKSYHANVTQVRDCFAQTAYEEACEAEAEAAYEAAISAAEDAADDYADAAYDRYRENRAEQGSWFGFGE